MSRELGCRLNWRAICVALPFMALTAVLCQAAEFEVGVARVKITPPTPFWLSGYASRTNPSSGILQDLWAKALAVRDAQGHQVVLVTMDLIGLPREVSDEVAGRAEKRLKLARQDLLLNCSHTHCGPAIGSNLSVMFEFNAEDASRVRDYTAELTKNLVRVTAEALHSLTPANLDVGEGSVRFAVNRRAPSPAGYRIGVNTNGPTDHTVPVLRITSPEGTLRAVLFAYSCHNTTMGGDFYEINGDYAGHAQAEFEKAHPGATAMFMMLCGGDQNPNPRGKLEQAREHGHALASEVDRVLSGNMRRVEGPIRSAYEVTKLELGPHTRELFEQELTNKDKYRQRRARLMLEGYDQGKPLRQVAYPVQAICFNRSLTLLGLGGEVVADYALRAKREFPRENLVVAGYCNDVMCYIPSRRVLLEGGYEPEFSMIYYGMPGPFAETVEEKIFATIRNVMKKVHRR